MILFNTGDSHTTCCDVGGNHATKWYWCPNMQDHYWYKIAKNHYNCTEIINDSLPGRSNDMMMKLVIKHCLENPNLHTLYIINITTIFRMDLTTPHSATLHDILIPKAISIIDFETIECTLYAHLIGLMEFLKSRNKDFLIINNGKTFGDGQLPMRDAYINYFRQEARILNWFDNGRVNFQENITKIKPVDFDKYGWNGHDSPEGHARYYEMLKNRLPNI